MISLKSENVEVPKPLESSNSASHDELHRWKHLVFSFDMDRDPSHPQRNPRKSRSDANLVSTQSGGANRFASAAGPGLDLDHGYPHGLPPTQYPNLGPAPGFYGNFFHHDSMSQSTSLPPLSSLDFPWTQLPPQQQLDLGHFDQQMGSSTMASSSTTFIPSQYHQSSMSHDTPSSPGSDSAGASGRASTSRSRSGTANEELTEGERLAMSEEKRRRNTAASARFRIKKKQKTVNLERSVSDLTGRAEELEREVSDLRRENGWLKEIVMLKGTRFAAANLNHRMALSQAAALALGGGQSSHGGMPSFPTGEGSSSHQHDSHDEDSEESDSEDERKNSKKRGDQTKR
ncbi:hypothetical protein FA15DRAFT_5043 [Coprinopsis marcescibilis]|uniref:BZIP domain-containing protein n=1 Tax=Coprinopsis marcescibilis TaxID=230819 RepID=A0A5C3LCP5_COPMA|nr:hypothetical protein FA15DRAFT_5043 [Coprinopsis marcescibilis]